MEQNENGFPIFPIIFILLVIVFIFRFLSFDTTVLRDVEMEPFAEPIQENIVNGKTFIHKINKAEIEFTPIANYKIYGRVLDRHYRPSKLPVAMVYPYDVSIGFGDFQHKEVYKSVKVKMASTVAYWSYSNSDYKKHLYKYFKEKPLEHYWTNNHLCPANKNIRKGISQLRKKDIVYIEGYLVKFKLRKQNGTIEKGISSTSRNDMESFSGDNGNGSCEQIYVTRIVSRHGDFR